jgi:transcriptional regulator with PAS, ATPase and Fis domain
MSCAALTETLLESELFGYEKGAFTGANARREGKFEAASGGTLFLDEIGDISPKLQLDLLRVLEERRVTRVGGTESMPVDVRIIAATNRDLQKAIGEGRFREDLFYRLNVITLTLAPLRDRKEDIPLLVDILLEQLAVEMKKPVEGVSPEGMALLLAHSWPGNVRELRNVLERLAAFPDLGAASIARALGKPERSEGEENGAAKLRAEVSSALLALPYHQAKERVLESFEKTYLSEHLKSANGVVTRAALRSGLPRQSFHRMLRRLGLSSSDE